MKVENMFEVAVRNKMRFPFKGMVSVEDLWDLSVENLDMVFKALNAQVKKVKEESLLSTKTKEDEAIDVQIELVKYIVGVKLAEAEQRKSAKAKREQRDKIMSIMSEKQNEGLKNKSVDELAAMLDELNA